MIWNENADCMEPQEKKEMQLALLQKQVKRVYENVPFYKKKFDDAGFHPDDLKTLEDVSKIPFTTKADLREAYPFGLFAVPEDEIVEIHSTSGTTGTPVVSGYTQKDIDIWGECTARAIGMAEEIKTLKSKIHMDMDYLLEDSELTMVQKLWEQPLSQCLLETLQDN